MVDQNHSFDVTVDLSNLSLQSVTGVMVPTSVAINPVDQNITVPQGFDSVQLAGATLSLEITNAVDLPGSLSVQDRKSTRLNSSHIQKSRMPSSA